MDSQNNEQMQAAGQVEHPPITFVDPVKSASFDGFVAFIRHGERGSMVPGFIYKNQHDTPLTPLGIKQARQTGKHLLEYWKQNNLKFDEIVIETSPFLRCLMTSSWIAKELGVKKVTVKYTLVEMLSKFAGITESPMEHLEFSKANFDFKTMKEQSPEYATEEWFPNDVEIVEGENQSAIKEEAFKMFPESFEQCVGRALKIAHDAAEFMSSIMDKSATSTCLLSISHGCHIDSLGHISDLDNCTPLAYQNFNDQDIKELSKQIVSDTTYEFPNFCSMTAYKIKNNQDQWVMKRYFENVKGLRREDGAAE